MAFFRREREAEATTLTMIRDIVEILAIVAAGIWAFYVFVYENRLKPASLQPDVTITGTMLPVGVSHGLEAIRLETTSKNVGTMPIKYLAFSVTVVGSNVRETKTPYYPQHTPVLDSFARHFRVVNPVVVYRAAAVTHDADPHAITGLSQQPGSSSSDAHVFYVPVGRYDRLVAIYVGRAARYDATNVETTMRIDRNGIPVLGGSAGKDAYTENDTITIATLALPSK